MEGRFSITVPRIFVLHCSLGECLSLCCQKTYPAHNNRTGNRTRAIAAAMTTSSIFICELVKINFSLLELSSAYLWIAWARGGGVLPYKGLMGTCGLPGYVFRDFCLKQGIEFINFCLKQGIKNRNSVLNRVGKSAIFVLNRVRVRGAAPHLPTYGYIEYTPREPGP